MVTTPHWFLLKLFWFLSFWYPEGRHGPSLSIDTKKVSVTIHLRSQWRFKWRQRHRKSDFYGFCQNISPKILEMCDFEEVFYWLWKVITIYQKYKVHSSNIFGAGATTKYRQVATTPSIPRYSFDSLLYLFPQALTKLAHCHCVLFR